MVFRIPYCLGFPLTSLTILSQFFLVLHLLSMLLTLECAAAQSLHCFFSYIHLLGNLTYFRVSKSHIYIVDSQICTPFSDFPPEIQTYVSSISTWMFNRRRKPNIFNIQFLTFTSTYASTTVLTFLSILVIY